MFRDLKKIIIYLPFFRVFLRGIYYLEGLARLLLADFGCGGGGSGDWARLMTPPPEGEGSEAAAAEAAAAGGGGGGRGAAGFTVSCWWDVLENGGKKLKIPNKNVIVECGESGPDLA